MRQRDAEGRFDGMFGAAVMLVLRFRVVALTLFLVITGLLSVQIKHIKIAQDPVESMISPGHSFYPALQAIAEMDTEPNRLVGILEVRGGDVYNTETVKKIDRITRQLIGMGEVMPGKTVSLGTGLNHYDNTAQGLIGEPILGRIPPVTEEDFDAVRRRVAVNPLGLGSYVSYDGTATMITASLVDIQTKSKTRYGQLSDGEKAGLTLEQYKKKRIDAFQANLLRTVREIETQEEDADYSVCFIGDDLLAAHIVTMGRRQIPIATAGMLLLLVVLLAAYFRSVSGVLVPVFAFALSVLWGMGILGASKIVLNPSAIVFPLMLGVLSLVFCALVIDEYGRSRSDQAGKTQAIIAAYGRAPVATSILAAGAVSLTLWLARVPMVRDLGFFCLFWLVGTFVVVVLVCPVLISLLSRSRMADDHRHGKTLQSVAEGLARPLRGAGKVGVLVSLGVVLAMGAFCAGRLTVGDNVPGASYVRPGHPWNECFNVLARKFNGPYHLLVYVKAKQEGGLLHPDAINEMGDFSTFLESEGGARHSIAFDWIMKMARTMLMDGNPKWWTIPASQQDVESLSRLITFPGGLEILVDKAFTGATIVSFFPDKETEHIDEYVSTIRAYIDRHPSEHVEFSLGGGLLGLTKAINDGARDAYVRSLAAAFVALFVFGAFVTRSVVMSLIVAVAIAAAQALVWLVMTAVGMAISMAVVPAAVVGVAFGSVLGFSLVRPIARPDSQSAESGSAGRNGMLGRAGGVTFLGILAFSGMLPWFFIGLKFQGDMALMLGITVVLQTIASVLFIPALAGCFGKQSY